VYIAIFLSGFAGLGYEMVWARMLALTLGHEIAAVLAVLASFFSGLALGAWCLDGVVSASPRPALWYALCEGVIGLWALLLTMLFPEANRTMHILTGVASSPLQLGFLCFLLPFLLLLPATFAMGGTLPALERLFATLRANGRCLEGLYSANIFGAVAGTMLTTFLLAPWLGSRASLIALAAVNFACAAAMWLLRLKTSPPDSSSMKAPVGRMNGKLAAVLLLTGFLGIGREHKGAALCARLDGHRVQDAELARELKDLRIDDFYSLFGCFVAGRADLSAFAVGAALNTDDRPVVIYQAPRYADLSSGIPKRMSQGAGVPYVIPPGKAHLLGSVRFLRGYPVPH
jgi:spermidine synthase